FEEHLAVVQQLRPEALVLPVPMADIELLAPQLTYFGLDTLGIRFLGTAEWAEPGVLQTTPHRHTDGFVVATPRRPGGPTEAYLRFVEDYETVLRKTLRSSIPALGYDAAGLMLEALASGMRSPRALRAALEEIRDFPGATGTLSIENGRVLREHHLVRLRDGDMIPIPLEEPDDRLMPAFPFRRGAESPPSGSVPVREEPRR
ncbi:MAG TPA: ABC transporter substrate-binding protein, partial [Longimicrobiales bacterium]|nr:ABC transporter substrate-binding protein [Longimicrobiales bacterium]